MKSKNVVFIIIFVAILLGCVFVFTTVNNTSVDSSNYTDNYTGENYNFRKTKWGYSKKQIINSEKTSLIKDDIGMENNTDIIRWLIHEKYEEIRLSIKSK